MMNKTQLSPSSASSVLPSFLSSSSWQKIPFFKDLSSTVLKEILTGAEVIRTKAKEEIFAQGEAANYFGFVIEGVFRLYRFDSARQRVIMDFVPPKGMMAGLLMASENSVYPVTAQSVQEGQYLKIPRSTYRDFWSKSPEIMKRVQIANMERVQSLQNMREVQRLPLEEKVAWAFLHLLSSLADENQILRSIFSRMDFGDLVGAAPESIIRIFSQWTKEGLVSKSDGEEYIDLHKLRERYFKNGF